MSNNLAGLYEYVDENYILAGVKADLNIRDSNIDDLYIKDNINMALKELRNLGTSIQAVTQLEIVDHKAKLPRGFIRFTKTNPIIYTDAEGHAISGVQSGTATQIATDAQGGDLGTSTVSFPFSAFRNYAPSYVDNAFFTNSPFDSSFTMYGTVNIVNGWMYFSSNIQARFIKIAYLTANINSDGDLVIPSYCERAIRAYCCYKYCRSNFDIPKYAAVMNDYKMEWQRGKGECKAISAMPSSVEYSAINRIMKSLF